MKKARKSLGILPVLVITMMTAFFAFSGIAGRLPLIGGMLGSVEVYAAEPYDSATPITPGETKTLTMNGGEDHCFKFTADEDAIYDFKSSSDEKIDTMAYLEVEDGGKYVPKAKDEDWGHFWISFPAEKNKTYYLIIRCGYGSANIPFNVSLKESEIKEIKYVPAKPIRLIEDVDGNYDEGKGYFVYNHPYTTYPYAHAGDKLIITTTTNEKREYIYDDEYDEYIGEAGIIASEKVKFTDDQETTPWVKENNNTLTVTYLNGIECPVTVEIIDNPIKKIAFEPKTPYVFDIGTGEILQDTNNEDYEYWEKWLYNDGDKLIVTTGGSETTYIYDAEAGGPYGRFVNADDSTDYIAGDEVERDWYCQHTKPWTEGSANNLAVKYKGRQTKITVVVRNNPITKIEFTPAVPWELVYHEDGSWENNDPNTGIFIYDTPDIKNGKLTVFRNAGSKEYFFSIHGMFMSEDGDCIRYGTELYEFNIDFGDTSKWTREGDNTVTVSYGGKTCTVPVKIVENNKVSAISFDPVRPYVLSEGEKNAYSGEYELRFTDGDKLTVTADTTKVYFYDRISGFVNRDNRNDIVNVNVTSDQSVPWTAGNTYKFTLEYRKQTCEVPVTIMSDADARDDAISKAQKLLDDVNKLVASDYTDSSFRIVTEKKEKLEKYITNSASTAERIKLATEALDNAVKALVTKEEEQERITARAAASNVISRAKALDGSDYTTKSFKAVTDAMTVLEGWLRSSTSGSSAIKAATKTLEDALNSLVTKEEERAEAVKEANKVIAKAKALIASEYTTDSFNAVTAALTALEALIADSTADSTKINAGTAVLNNAINNLQKVAQPPTNPTVKQSQPMKVTAKNKAFKANKLKKKKAIFKAVTVKNAQGSVTYTVKGNKKSTKALKFNKKNGKITVRKGTKKGKYVLKITVNAAGNELYEAGTKTVKVTVKVK